MVMSFMSILHQGLIFSLVSVAVYFTSRVINKDDLTVEGSFGFGGAITAVLLAHGVSSIVVLLLATLFGSLIGASTGVLYARLKMNHLMAGLVTTTGCFSLSLGLASANKIIAAKTTIFALLPWFSAQVTETLILAIIAVGSIVLARLFLKSEMGLILRATGDNPHLLVHFAKSADRYYVLGFAIANALTALAGSLFVQWSGFFSITGNIGTLVTGLASLMLAELFSKKLSLSIIFSAILYQSIFVFTLMLKIPPVFNNLTKASLMVILVVITAHLKKQGLSRAYHH